MDKILDMIAQWPAGGQGLFFLATMVLAVYFVSHVLEYFVCLFRGWPTKGSDD